MKSTAIVFAVVASLGFGSLALAQNNDRRNQNDEFPRTQRQVPQQSRQAVPQRYGNQDQPPQADPRTDQRIGQRMDQRVDRRTDRMQDRRFDQRDERWNNRRDYYNARGPEFRRGGYVPSEFRNRQYVVADYRMHRLPSPPRNHEWVQIGSDYVLIAIATGIIANIVLSQ